MDDFENGFDFYEAFVAPFLPPPLALASPLSAADPLSGNQQTLFTK